MSAPATRTWHVGRWGPLGWMETALKLAAHVVAFTALARAFDHAADLPGEPGWFALVVMALLAVGLTAAIGDRLLEREIVAMAFVAVNVLAHWAMVVAMARTEGPGGLLAAFCLLMIAGDLVKLVFLRTRGFRVRELGPGALMTLTGVYVAGYVAVLIAGM